MKIIVVKDENGRTCCKCGEYKPWSEFHRDSAKLTGYYPNCKPCRKSHYEATYNSDTQFVKNLRRNHGMTVDDLEKMLEDQGNECAICGVPFGPNPPVPGYGPVPNIDHDHNCPECGSNKSCVKCRRGLLCGKCNKGIGLLNDNIDILMSAIVYLENSNG